jgi:hypothetical protein
MWQDTRYKHKDAHWYGATSTTRRNTEEHRKKAIVVPVMKTSKELKNKEWLGRDADPSPPLVPWS